MKAVIPAAGLGTRFLPLTKNSPKEMLPIIDKPAIQYVVEEAINSGIDDIVIITGRGKEVIENHFDVAYELEKILEERGEKEKLNEVRKISEMAEIFYIRQKMPLGLGHAIYMARKHISEEFFAVLLGDDIIVANQPCTKQLIDVYEKYNASVIAIQEVEMEYASKYGIVDAEEVENGIFKIKALVEKPAPREAPSNLAVMGRYILSPKIFGYIEKTKPGKKGEIQLTDALNMMLENEELYAYVFEGKRYDLGDKFDWLRINIEMALKREEFRDRIIELIKKLINQGRNIC
ncbi:MAG TPA: UTP--glucose-1-phosphate uridylyltransferase GalU [Thermoplasmatales archaeon]|nr:UTP--glucose-1-phosphate uridylyltransferase GalU [Thermoplasmatales archaeon]